MKVHAISLLSDAYASAANSCAVMKEEDISSVLDRVGDHFRNILSHHHRIPPDSDQDQCAVSKLGVDPTFAQSQPYNIKSVACQIQASDSCVMASRLPAGFSLFRCLAVCRYYLPSMGTLRFSRSRRQTVYTSI